MQKSKHVLIVDDEVIVLEYLSAFFETFDPEPVVHAFNDEVEAIHFIKDCNNQIDLAILDLKLKILTGIEIADTIMDYRSNASIIFITGYGEKEAEDFNSQQRVRNEFPAMIFTKPLNSAILKDYVQAVLYPESIS